MDISEFKSDIIRHCADIEDKYIKEVIRLRLNRMTEKRWKLLYDKFVVKIQTGDVNHYKEIYMYIKHMKELKSKKN